MLGNNNVEDLGMLTHVTTKRGKPRMDSKPDMSWINQALDIINGRDAIYSRRFGSYMGPNEWDDFKIWVLGLTEVEQQEVSRGAKWVIGELIPLTPLAPDKALEQVDLAVRKQIGIVEIPYGWNTEGYQPIVNAIGKLVKIISRLPNVDESVFLTALLQQLPRNSNPYILAIIKRAIKGT